MGIEVTWAWTTIFCSNPSCQTFWMTRSSRSSSCCNYVIRYWWKTCFSKSSKVRRHLLYKKTLTPKLNILSKILSNLKVWIEKMVQGVSIAAFLFGLTFAYLNLLYQRLWMLAVCGFLCATALIAVAILSIEGEELAPIQSPGSCKATCRYFVLQALFCSETFPSVLKLLP